LIPTAKMETRHPVEGLFGTEFPYICNYCRVMGLMAHNSAICGGMKSQDVEKNFNFNFLRFFGKRPIMGKFSKFCSEMIHGDTIDVLCSNFLKFGRRKIGKVMRYLR